MNVNFSRLILNVETITVFQELLDELFSACTFYFLKAFDWKKLSSQVLTLTLLVSFLFIANITGQTVSVSNK